MQPISLYIHIPFCNNKCPYCDFYSINQTDEKMDEYTNQVLKKIKAYSQVFKREIKTIYFGGGTPSILGTQRLVKIINEVYSNFIVQENAEVTLEMNPCTNDLIDFKILLQNHFNRLSIGMQSANEDELMILKRKHTKNEVEITVRNAQKAGFKNISVDMILCIPDQTKEKIFNTVEFCKQLRVQHVSAYILKYEKGTEFYAKKNVLDKFSEDEQAELYEYTVKMLDAYGYKQYEISNFSLEGFESKHNLTYWHDEEYLGIGCSAHSFIDNKRFYVDRSFADFYNNKLTFESIGGEENEYIMLALRLNEGLSFNKFEEKYNKDLDNKILERAKFLASKNLMYCNDKNMSLTIDGMLLSNQVISYLLKD